MYKILLNFTSVSNAEGHQYWQPFLNSSKRHAYSPIVQLPLRIRHMAQLSLNWWKHQHPNMKSFCEIHPWVPDRLLCESPSTNMAVTSDFIPNAARSITLGLHGPKDTSTFWTNYWQSQQKQHFQHGFEEKGYRGSSYVTNQDYKSQVK